MDHHTQHRLGLQSVCCVSDPLRMKREVVGPQEWLTRYGLVLLWTVLRSPQAGGRPPTCTRRNGVMQSHWEPKVGLGMCIFAPCMLTGSAELNSICQVQHENKNRPLASASAAGWRESAEKKLRGGRRSIHSACVCWQPHGHSRQRRIRFQSEVNQSESQDWRVGKFTSIILFGLWFWNHCALQRVVLCGWWLRCYNYHYNYTGMFPSWRAPWNYSPVTWPEFLIVLTRWTAAFYFFFFWPGCKLVGVGWVGRTGMPR